MMNYSDPKLMTSDIFKAHCPSNGIQHIVILDWDDTLMPTTYLLSHIDFEVDQNTKRVKTFRFKPGSNGKENEIRQTLKESGTAALRMLKALYLYFVDRSSGRNLLIVTNGVAHWLWNSLIIAGTLCPIYRRIQQLLQGQNTQIIYARNHKLHPIYWKMMSFEVILGRFLKQKPYRKLNVITIGDQWTDHCSIEMTSTYRYHPSTVSHHQIKLYPGADARYLAVELNYIADVLTHTVSRSSLLQFAAEGIVLEFDGYHGDTDSVRSIDSDSDCTETPTGTPK